MELFNKLYIRKNIYLHLYSMKRHQTIVSLNFLILPCRVQETLGTYGRNTFISAVFVVLKV